ncbi:MAG: DUF481 domain-containing protein [Betaproteobacteria bacterium]|nr:MAG: DUF481 domain-containing protein [Betaproteobacteria bacterium]
MKNKQKNIFWWRHAWTCVVLLICITVGMRGNTVHAQGTEEPVDTGQAAGETSESGLADPYEDDDEETQPAEVEEIAERIDPWKQFFPPPDSQFDWLRLTSGEWLKGELKSVYNFQVEFESDELDTLTFDWDDVSVIRSAGLQAVRYVDVENSPEPLVTRGQLTLINDTATIGSGPDAITINRRQIVSIAKGTQKERDFWSGELTIGANVRSGNTEVTDSSIYFLVQRRRAISRFFADYRASFSSTRDVETQNNHRVNTFFDQFRTRRWYWRVVFAEYFRDKFQNVENQFTIGTGAGYDIIRNSKTEWDVFGGLGALYKQAVSVEEGEDAGNTSPAITFGTTFDTELTKRLDYYIRYVGRVVDEANGQYIHNLVTTLSSDIVGELDLDLTWVWDRTQKPAQAADGSTPDQDDYRFTVGISYEF